MATNSPPHEHKEEEEEESLLDTLTGALGLGGSESKEDSLQSSTPEEDEEEKDEEALAAEAVAEGERARQERKAQGALGKKKKERLVPIPKTTKAFYRALVKYPKLFKINQDGDLSIPEIRGVAAHVLELPSYTETTLEEQLQRETLNHEKLAAVEREVEETSKLLKEAFKGWKETGITENVISLNRKMMELDAQRTLLRSPERWIRSEGKLEVRKVDFSQPNEVRKTPYSVYVTRLRSVAFEELTKISAPSQKARPGIQVDIQQRAPQVAEEFTVFNEPDQDFGEFSPDRMQDFVYKGTKYTSLIQAYHGERLTQLNRKELRPLLLKLRSTKQIRAFAARVTGEVEAPLELLKDLVRHIVSQHPDLKEALKETETSMLVYANPLDSKLGIGLAEDSDDALDRTLWKGENLLGQAWVSVREAEKEGEEEEEEESKQEGGGASYTEHGRTEEEVKQQRSRVLMGMYRRRH